MSGREFSEFERDVFGRVFDTIDEFEGAGTVAAFVDVAVEMLPGSVCAGKAPGDWDGLEPVYGSAFCRWHGADCHDDTGQLLTDEELDEWAAELARGEAMAEGAGFPVGVCHSCGDTLPGASDTGRCYNCWQDFDDAFRFGGGF